MRSKVQKWGNSLGVRLPKAIAKELKMEDGSPVEIKTSKNQIIIESIEEESLELLLSKITDENIPAEIDFGKTEGKETW